MTPPPTELPSITGAIQGADLGAALGAGAAAGSGAGGLTVTAEALLNAANKLQREAVGLRTLINADGLKDINECGHDPVSGPAAIGFQAKIGPIVTHVTTYVDNLTAATNELRDQARKYGATEEQIKLSMASMQSQAPQ